MFPTQGEGQTCGGFLLEQPYSKPHYFPRNQRHLENAGTEKSLNAEQTKRKFSV